MQQDVSINKKKKVYIEIMRIFAILLVLYNHTGGIGFSHFTQYEAGSLSFWLNLGQAVFCKIGAYLFFVVSGALLLHRPQERIRDVYVKRILKYCFIIICISIIYAISNMIFKGKIYTVSSFLEALYTSSIRAHLWFLYAYIAFLAMLPVLKAFCKGMENKHFIYIILMYFATRIIYIAEYLLWKGKVSIESSIMTSLPLNSVILPLMGYFLEHRVDIEKVKNKLWLIWIVNIALIALTCYVTYVKGIDTGVFSEKKSQTYLRYFTFYNCLSVYLTVKWLFTRIKLNERAEKVIVWIGSCSFGVYLYHLLFKDSPYGKVVVSMLQKTGLPQFIIAWMYVLSLFIPSLLLTTGLKFLLTQTKHLLHLRIKDS